MAGSYCRRQVLRRLDRCQPPGAQARRAGWTSHPIPGRGRGLRKGQDCSPVCTHSQPPSQLARFEENCPWERLPQPRRRRAPGALLADPPGEVTGEPTALPSVRGWGGCAALTCRHREMTSAPCWATEAGWFVTQPKWHQELIPCPSSKHDWHLWAENSKKAKRKGTVNDNLGNVFWDEELNEQIKWTQHIPQRTDTE